MSSISWNSWCTLPSESAHPGKLCYGPVPTFVHFPPRRKRLRVAAAVLELQTPSQDSVQGGPGKLLGSRRFFQAKKGSGILMCARRDQSPALLTI